MKNLYSKNEFLTLQKEDEMITENFIGKMFKGLWNSVMKLSNKVKGSKEINTVYDKYKKLVDETFAKVGNVGAAETVAANTNKPEKPVTTPPATTSNVSSSFSYTDTDKLNEADDVDPNPATTPPAETAENKKEKYY